MADVGKLVYKDSGTDAGKLCYKASGADAGKLVYKVQAGDWTTVTFAWSSQGRDLDICAYWTGAQSMVMGFGHNTSTAEQTSGAYHIFYSGDKQGANDAEWVRIKMQPWNIGNRTFNVHLNFYGYDSTYFPESSCTVIVSQLNGETIILNNVTCSTRTGNKYLSHTQNPDPGIATTSDPGVSVTFDATGHLQSVEKI